MNPNSVDDGTSATSLLLLTSAALLTSGYMLVRFGGMFASNDVGVHSSVAASIVETQSLTGGATYSNGFGYPALVALLSSFTGVSIATLQSYVFPILLAVPVGAAYITSREILGERQGTFAALLFLLHPAFLFTAYRSTHEKFTYALILLTLYSLYISFKSRHPSTRARAIGVGYLCISGITLLNIYFASALITAVIISLGGAFLFSIYFNDIKQLRRLSYTSGISFAFLLVFVFFLYPPAQTFLRSLGSVSVQTLVLLFGSAPSATSAAGASPYTSVFTRWQSFGLYLVLVSFYFVVYPLAGLSWLNYVRSLFSKEGIDEGELPDVFLFILAAAFGFLLVGAIIADQTGLLGANMQLRVFPLLGFVSIILSTRSIFGFLEREGRSTLPSIPDDGTIGSVRRVIVPVTLIVLVVGFSGAAAIKATNDPAVSNVWTVATEEERAMMVWTESNLEDEHLWAGYNPRIRNDHRIRHPGKGVSNRYDLITVNLAVRYLIISDTMLKEAVNAGVPIPPRADTNRVYTNGAARVYWFEQYRTFDEYNAAWG